MVTSERQIMRHMIRILILFLLPMCAYQCYGKMSATLSNDNPVYGKPVQLEIVVPERMEELDKLDYTALRKHFVIQREERQLGSDFTLLSVTLYARKPGDHVIPALSYKSWQAKPLVMSVEKIDSTVPSQSQYRCNKPRVRVMQRETINLSCHFVTTDAQADLALERPDARLYYSFIVPVSKRALGKGLYRYDFGWKIIPLRDGKRSLEVPEVSYRFKRYRLFTYPIELQVLPLPAYIRPDTAVGQLSLRLVSDTALVHFQDYTYFVTYELRGEGMPAAWLPDLDHELRSTRDVSVDLIHTRLQNQVKQDKLTGIKIMTYSVRPKTQGHVQIPAVSLQYLSPHPGKTRIEAVRVASVSLFSINYGLLLVLLSALVLLLIYFLFQLVLLMRMNHAHRRRLRELQSRLRQVQRSEECRDVLRRYVSLYRLNSNLPLRQLVCKWKLCYKDNPYLQDIVKQLNESLYCGKSEQTTFERIKQSLQELIATRSQAILR